MSPSVILSLCITWSLFAVSISYTEEVVHYRTYPYRYKDSPYVPSTGEWESWDGRRSRSDRPTYRRNTHVPHYTQLVKVEQEQSDPLVTISETLGALNTVGNYIVNMTRGETSNYPPKELPSALYTISKNILGRNVTDSIAPLVRGVALPLRQPITSSTETPSVQQQQLQQKQQQMQQKQQQLQQKQQQLQQKQQQLQQKQQQQQPTKEVVNREKESSPTCPTSEGGLGKCQDLGECPQLLLDLNKLRQSVCFKSLFIPGVCCPVDKIDDPSIPATSGVSFGITEPPIRPTIRPTKPLRPRPIPLYPVTSSTTTTTTRPSTHIVLSPDNNTNNLEIGTINNNFIQNDDECGMANVPKFRVVGGEEALPGRWPWMAAIFLTGTKRTEFWCGGTLIGSRYILTAAHCTRDMRQQPFLARQFTVRLGDIDLQRNDEPSSPQTYKVKKVHAHENFSRYGYYNDIAILELTTNVRRSSYVVPICLPQAELRAELFAGARATVVGWGSTYHGGKESNVQRQTIVPVWRNDDCNASYFQPITSKFLCAGYTQGGRDACQGDSGGPLMLRIHNQNGTSRWTQIGIVSFGNKCGEPGYPGVYTRVTAHMDWIKRHMK